MRIRSLANLSLWPLKQAEGSRKPKCACGFTRMEKARGSCGERRTSVHPIERDCAARAEGARDHVLLISDDARVTYGEMNRLGARIAAALRRSGASAGDTIAVLAANGPAYLALMVGAARAGMVLAAIPVSAEDGAKQAMIRDSGATLLFTDEVAVQGFSRGRDAGRAVRPVAGAGRRGRCGR